MAQELSGKTLISLENVAKLFVIVSTAASIIYSMKLQNQQLRNDIVAAINGYKAEDRILDLRITACELTNKDNKKNIDFIYHKLVGLIPEKVKRVKEDEDQ